MLESFLTTLAASSNPSEICTLERSVLGRSLLLSGTGAIRLWLELATGESFLLLQISVFGVRDYSTVIAGFGFTKGDRILAIVFQGEVLIRLSVLPILKTIRLRVQPSAQSLLFFPVLVNGLKEENIPSFPPAFSPLDFPLLPNAYAEGETLALYYLATQGLIDIGIAGNTLSWVPILAVGELLNIGSLFTFTTLPALGLACADSTAELLQIRQVRQLAIADSATLGNPILTFTVLPALNLACADSTSELLQIRRIGQLAIADSGTPSNTINFRLVALITVTSDYKSGEQLAFRRL